MNIRVKFGIFLGAGETGKTTFIKQMRIIHGDEYKDDEKRSFTKLVYQNTISAMQSLIKAMETMKIQYEDKDNFNVAARIMNVNVESLDLNKMESDWSDAIKKMWKDNGILDCYSKRNQFQLIDSAR
jgi:uncharacterized membrane protein